MLNRNIAKCAFCGDIIESVHRHHFVTCKCGSVSIDGGKDYRRTLGALDAALDLTPEDIEAWDAIPTGRLEGWKAVGVHEETALFGRVYDDKLKRFHDDTVIRTSRLADNSIELKEGMLVETNGSKYLLGKPLTEEEK
jgi:hypothetical protein